MKLPPPDGIKGGRTPGWNCPACLEPLGVVHLQAVGRFICWSCDRTWPPALFASLYEEKDQEAR